MAAAAVPDKARLRIMRFLSQGSAKVAEAAAGENVLLDAGDRGTISVAKALLAKMARDGLVKLQDGRMTLTGAALASGKRANTETARFQDQHRDLDTAVIDVGAGPDVAVINWSESPLGQLMRRKTRDGASFLSSAEYEAGERLRADYTRGQIMPRLSANWVASVVVGTPRRRHRRPDRCSACGPPAGGAGDRRSRAGAFGRSDRRVLLPERHGNGGDGTRMAGPLGEDRA